MTNLLSQRPIAPRGTRGLPNFRLGLRIGSGVLRVLTPRGRSGSFNLEVAMREGGTTNDTPLIVRGTSINGVLTLQVLNGDTVVFERRAIR